MVINSRCGYQLEQLESITVKGFSVCQHKQPACEHPACLCENALRWDAAGSRGTVLEPRRGGFAFCGHCLTCNATPWRYEPVERLSNHIRAWQVNSQSAVQCETSLLLFEEIITEKNKKIIIIKAGVGSGRGPAGMQRIYSQSQIDHTLDFSHICDCWLILLTWSSRWDMWRVILANEPDSLFGDYMEQVHRALLKKTLLRNLLLMAC